MTEILIFIISGTLAASTALVFAAMGEVVAEKSGMLNLGVEGMMATGAAAGFVTVAATGSHAAGFVVGALAAMALALVYALLAIALSASQVACGLAVGILGLGVSSAIGKAHEGTTIPQLSKLSFGFLSDIPVAGPAFFQLDVMVYISILLIVAVWWVLNRTTLGLKIRAIGEDPQSAHALGLPVRWVRAGCVLFGGAMAGIGGAYLATAYTPLWADGMIAGRGWIVIALTVFGTWVVPRVVFGAYLFGAISLLELSIQAFGLQIPSQMLSALPYVFTIVMLALISRKPAFIRQHSPASLGAIFRPS